jgi:4-amino-4-deoxy-L-arabinose transferase-like glycosyltransferase
MNKQALFTRVVKDIRFWIIFFFILRLYGITYPPLEVGHNWRQTDGLMIARNFYERDANIFYPTVDVAGEKTGIVGSEFPILNYVIYLTSLLFGFEHWHGRLVVLVFSSIGTFFFCKLIRRYFDERSAFIATIFLLVSFWFSYSRKIIPDVFAASLCLVALYYCFRYFDEGKPLHLIWFLILAALGCLSKIVVATILTVLIFPIFNSKVLLQRKVLVSLCSIVIITAVCLWYFYWVPYLNSTFGYHDHFYMGVTFKEGIQAILGSPGLVLKRLYNTPFKYVGFAAFLAALFLVVKNRDWTRLGLFLIPYSAFLVILLKTGTSIIGDTYYVITAIPAMSFIIGSGLSNIKNNKIVVAILIVVGIESLAAQIYDFRLREPYKSLATLEKIMDSVSQKNDLIVVSGGAHNPTAMYFAHRRGWTVSYPVLEDSVYVADMVSKGCKFAVLPTKLYEDIQLRYPKVHESEFFRIYKLE